MSPWAHTVIGAQPTRTSPVAEAPGASPGWSQTCGPPSAKAPARAGDEQRATAKDRHQAQVGESVVADDEARIGDLDRVRDLRQPEHGPEDDLQTLAHNPPKGVRAGGSDYP